MSQQDADVYKPFIWVLGALVVFTFFIAFMANIFSPLTDRSTDQLVLDGIKKQIAPIGQSRVTENSMVAPTPKPAEPVAEEVTQVASPAVKAEAEPATTEVASAQMVASTDGIDAALNTEIPLHVRAVVATNCAGCHQAGVNGAQRSDDVEAWTLLADKGLDNLTSSVINGKGAMMARADTDLNDEDLGLAVRHMVAMALGDQGNAQAETQAVATPQAESDSPAVEPSAEKAETAIATVAPTEIPAAVKTVVDTLCASCHISGVANAPKYGDKAAWDQRMSAGIDAVLASAIAGKGAMPARGGSQLSDAELKLAIEYMASK